MEKRRTYKEKAAQKTGESPLNAERMTACMRLTAIGQLTAGVAHELNNPLSVILGYVQSLAQHHDNQETLHASLKTVERETLRCKRLVQDLLNFSRLPRPGKVREDVIQVLEGALSLAEAQARIQHVELIREFSEPLPMIYLDRHRIQQMMINLCTNAMDAMPKGGRLTVGARQVSNPGEAPVLEIRVSDTGTGIPPDIKKRIFEPFFTTKEPGKGTGLGLSLVREIVKEHAGRLEFMSKQGEGTTFSIRLPANNRAISPRPDGNNLSVSGDSI